MAFLQYESYQASFTCMCAIVDYFFNAPGAFYYRMFFNIIPSSWQHKKETETLCEGKVVWVSRKRIITLMKSISILKKHNLCWQCRLQCTFPFSCSDTCSLYRSQQSSQPPTALSVDSCSPLLRSSELCLIHLHDDLASLHPVHPDGDDPVPGME